MSSPYPQHAYRLDRAAFSVVPLDEQDDEGEYWQSKTPEERICALGYLRWLAYGDAASGRLQRVLTVVELGED